MNEKEHRYEVFTKDRELRNEVDYEGCGIGSGKYSRYAEMRGNISDNKIIIGMGVIFGLLLLLTLGVFVGDCIYKNKYKCVTMEVLQTEDETIEAVYEGKNYTLHITPSVVKTGNNKVKVYYENRIGDGKVVFSMTEFFIFFIITFGGVFISAFILYRNLHRSKHSEGITAQGKFDD